MYSIVHMTIHEGVIKWQLNTVNRYTVKTLGTTIRVILVDEVQSRFIPTL